ncbi:hypothetical protein GGI15_003759 [Coemansia interrupta]|uniref:Serine carboxypeptidase n=1 Tax=Coemansia interrupta TaxID=1126814 RepID=A0A9W8HCN7_9FUNG|nr:hypothetical protein GGI15_003759 [Coemansia interrupta]
MLFQALVSALVGISYLAGTEAAVVPLPPSSTPYWFRQPVDHFGSNSNTWEQQYLVNYTFYKAGGPIYLTTPGESPVGTQYIDNTHFTVLAKATNGLLVTIEHRFFGQSNPMPDLSGASLKYLTIENVLEDFASFARSAKNHPQSLFSVPVSCRSKIIFGGGSYSGNIAAWMRAKYPDLIQGAWASSAIVYGRLQYYQFDQSYGRHLEALGCAQNFSQAVKDVDDILLSKDALAISDLQSRFGVPTTLGVRDTAGLLAALSTTYSMQAVTSTSDYVDQSVCSFFRNKTATPLEAYIASVSSVIQKNGMNQQSLVQMGDSSIGIDNYALGQVGRVWYYMACTWNGNWQIAPPSNTGLSSYRSQLLDLDYFEPNCQNKFGNGIEIPVDVQSYNSNWFDILEGVSNIYYTSGSLDIWRDSTVAASTGNLLTKTPGSTIVLIQGATHVQDLRAEMADDLDSVKRARQAGDALVAKWLNI